MARDDCSYQQNQNLYRLSITQAAYQAFSRISALPGHVTACMAWKPPVIAAISHAPTAVGLLLTTRENIFCHSLSNASYTHAHCYVINCIRSNRDYP